MGYTVVDPSIDYDDNDLKSLKIFHSKLRNVEAAAAKILVTHDTKQAPGLDIHEMGGVRMGNDPKTSLLNSGISFITARMIRNRWSARVSNGNAESFPYFYGVNCSCG